MEISNNTTNITADGYKTEETINEILSNTF